MKGRLEFILDNALWPVLLVDTSTRIRAANEAAIEFFGNIVEGDSSLLSIIWAPVNELPAEQFLARPERAKSEILTASFKVRGGAIVKMRVYLCPATVEDQKFVLFQFLNSDPVESKSVALPMQSQTMVDVNIAQKQKLDCAMQLIRSVVLDFNNALTTILGHTSLLLSKMDPESPWRKSLGEVEKSAEKAGEIAQDLANFSRQEKENQNQAAGNLNDLLRRITQMVRPPESMNIEWNLDLEPRLYGSQFDEAKLQQAFIKILENSIQAGTKEIQIQIVTRNIDSEEIKTPSTGHPSAFVRIEFIDNGCGIIPDILPRIFEPFFTTKPNHRGLGLAWVYGIVTNHGGTVRVTSQPGKQTCVCIHLPAVKRFVRDKAPLIEDLTGTQTLLYVDDEPSLLTMGQMILASYGYRVMIADCGEKALDLFMRHRQQIALVITDLVMPHMSGREFAERLHRISPEMKILFCSGYSRPGSREDETFLKKPFTSQELLTKVKQFLS